MNYLRDRSNTQTKATEWSGRTITDPKRGFVKTMPGSYNAIYVKRWWQDYERDLRNLSSRSEVVE